jgi:hypothetical protein
METIKTAVEFYREELNGLVSFRETKFKTEQEIFEQAKEMEKQQKGYSEEDLFKILLDFVAFPHPHMEPRGSIIERYLNEFKKNKNNGRSPN